MVYSHRKSGQPGPLTRIVSCTPEEWASLSEQEKNFVPTHVAPSFTRHPRTGDQYAAYNKPVAVIDWLARTDVKEDYVLIIDADMIMRRAFIPELDGAKPGRAVSAYFGYMKGVMNKLADKHIPEIAPRNDTLAGPQGRRSDQVGGFTMMHVRDLRRVAPLWLKYTEDVRFDPDAWELTGDAYSKHPGDRPWISEMYGYSYACAKADVWHVVDHSAMLYPGYTPVGESF
jgi:peptidyl serine alpha-galactosyltransferase